MSQRVKPLDAPTIDSRSRNLATWSLLAGLALFAALAAPFCASRVDTADDGGERHRPLRAHHAEPLARSEFLGWTSRLHGGFDTTDEGRMGGCHPFYWLLDCSLPPQAAFAGERLLPYPVMMAGMWLFLRRRLGRSDAAMFGSLLFTFCGFNLSNLIHPNAIAIIAHIPWLLWAIDVVLTAARRRWVMLAAVLIAVLTGSQLLLGVPQYVWLSLLIEFGYACLVVHADRYAPRSECEALTTCADCVGCNTATWPWLLIAKVIGFLIGGVQIVPMADAWMHGAPPAADSQCVYGGSLHPLNLVQLVAPYLFSNRVIGDGAHEFGLYVGVVPVMLAAWLLIRRHDLADFKPLAKACVCLALFSLVLAIGPYGPPYRLLAYVPLLNVFRFPCRYVLLFEFAATVLAAIGFVLLLQENRRVSEGNPHADREMRGRREGLAWRRFEPLWVVVAVATAVAVAGFKLRNEPYIASVPAIMIGPVLFLAAAWLVMMAARGYRGALIGLILLAAADQGHYGMSGSVHAGNAGREESALSPEAAPDEADRLALTALPQCGEPGLRSGDQMTLTDAGGELQAVHRVNGDFHGCVAGPGESQVVLEFRPESLWWGWLASLAGMGMASLCLFGGVFSETRLENKDKL